MPTPNKGEKRKDFVDRCIPILVNEGKAQDQAIAICESMYDDRNKKKSAAVRKTLGRLQ